MSSPYASNARFDAENLDRDRALDREEAEGRYLYCIHCERAYERGYFRQVGALQMCPYEGCDGDAVLDAWPWTQIADTENPTYPAQPEIGRVYPMYGGSRDDS